MESQVYEIKRRIFDLEKKTKHVSKTDKSNTSYRERLKPKRSHFDCKLILIVLSSKLRTSASYRSLSNIIIIVNLYLQLELRTPSHRTIGLWVKKIGLMQLKKEYTKADDWILIFDDSIGIGQEKLLIVLGIRECNVDFTRPLGLQDMSILCIQSKEQWNGKIIAEILTSIKDRIGGVKYAITDNGSMLLSSLKLTGINHVADITHYLAIILKRIYEKDEQFKELMHKAGQMRFKECCGKQAHLIPPNQRSTSRFLNIDIISKWCKKALDAYYSHRTNYNEKITLEWLIPFESFLKEMEILMEIIKTISIFLKYEGINSNTIKKCKNELKKCKTGKLIQFKKFFSEYLAYNTVYIKRKKDKLLCCSDVVESMFGKQKSELSKNLMNGVTDSALLIAALTAKLTPESIKEAIDEISVKDINNWKKENLCSSLLAKRKAVFC